MKKCFTALTVLALLIFAACEKSDSTNNNNNNNSTSYFLKAKFNGVEANGTLLAANKKVGSGPAISATVNVNGKSYGVALGISNYIGVKTYKGYTTILMGLTSAADSTGYGFGVNDSTSFIKITEDNGTEVKGEFGGKLYKNGNTASESIEITDGSFHLKWL